MYNFSNIIAMIGRLDMKKNLKIASVIALLFAFQSCTNAFAPDTSVNTDYLACDYSRLVAYTKNPSDNIFISPELSIGILDIDKEMTISKVINDDFNLDMDIDVNSKKQLKPKAKVIEGYKIKDDGSSECVEKVMTPKLKKYNDGYQTIVQDDVENIDIDIVDINGLPQKTKPAKVAKVPKQKDTTRVSWFKNLFNRDKTKTIAQKSKESEVFDSDTIASDFNNSDAKKISKPKVEKVKPVKVAKEKPIKVAKVSEPKVEKVKPVKVAKEKPIKVAKEKPVKVAKVSEPKVEKVKPVKVAKEKPIKIAKEKPIKVAKEKSVKVAKVSEPKVEKVKLVKVAKEKPIKIAKEKPVKVAKVSEPKHTISTQSSNIGVLNNAVMHAAEGSENVRYELAPAKSEVQETSQELVKVATVGEPKVE